MRHLGRGGCWVVVALALVRVTAWAASGTPPPQFRGLTWGAAPTSDLRPEQTAGAQQTYGNARHDYRPFFGIPVADEEYVFTAGKLSSGQVTVRGEQGFVKLKAELTHRFGAPAIPKPDVFRWAWEDPEFEMTLTYDPRVKTTVVALTPGQLPAPPPVPRAPASAPSATGATQIACHGTEPPWRLDIDGTTARYAAGGTAETAFLGTARWLEQAKPPLLAWRGHATGATTDLVAFVAREACTEAPSGGAAPLPYTVRVSAPGGEVLLGCCRGPADAAGKPVSLTGGWVRRASGGTAPAHGQEGIVFRPDGTFRLLGIASMNGVAWRLEGDTLVVTTNTERYPDPSESKLRIEELSDGRLVLGGRVNYFEGTWERRDLAQVTGTVTSRPPGALPADAVVLVELRDLSAETAPGALVAGETLRTPGAMPVTFRLDYDPATVDAAHAYAVQARVVSGGQPRLATEAAVRVITGGSPTQVELVVVPIH